MSKPYFTIVVADPYTTGTAVTLHGHFYDEARAHALLARLQNARPELSMRIAVIWQPTIKDVNQCWWSPQPAKA